MQAAAIAILTVAASAVGTMTGFGTSTIMVPVLLLSYAVPETLLFAGIIHWFGNLWKMPIFIIASLIGARIAKGIVDRIPQKHFRTVVGVFLLLVALKLLLWPAK